MMQVSLTGSGAWGPGVQCSADISDPVTASAEVRIPRPSIIPAREMRRSPTASRLAVEVAVQACEAAGQNMADIRSVFTSSLGDSDITDYMCRTLAGSDKLLSPTRFHNSVHNAAAGSWSIACSNPAPTSFVAGFGHSSGLALLETLSLVVTDGKPTLLVAVDVPVPGALSSVHGNGTTAAVALVMEPLRTGRAVCSLTLGSNPVTASGASAMQAADPALSTAGLWPLIGAVARAEGWSGELSVGAQSTLQIELAEGDGH